MTDLRDKTSVIVGPDAPPAPAKPAAPPRTPTLTQTSGGEQGRWHTMDSRHRAIFVGRDAGNEFAIDHPSISRRHARFWLEAEGPNLQAWVQDLSSRNGTFVNGRRIEKFRLSSGDRVLVGDIELRFDLLDGADLKYRHELAERIARGDRDALTGLLLRRAWEELVPPLLERAERGDQAISCIVFDLDHFKAVNDQHGHAAGDEVLRTAGAVIRQCLRKDDLAIRYGGEEFVIVLPGIRRPVARTMAERLREAMAKQAHPALAGRAVTASLGVAEWAVGESQAMWLDRADRALYAAKEHGRNRTEAAPPPAAPRRF